jgi:5-(carboxyamino)imidazole ribonucleotide synthase
VSARLGQPAPSAPIPPGAWLGLLGGGQLGRMFTMAAQRMGYRVAVVDPGADSPAGSVADRHLRADYLDPSALEELARLCAAVTTEFENVPARALEFLAGRCRVSPAPGAVEIAQDRLREKRFVRDCGIAVGPYAEVSTAADLERAGAELFPGILKVARLGYDGKGQARVAGRDEAHAAWTAFGRVRCVLEQRLELARELSVIVARRAGGDRAHFPVAENEHVNGILDTTIAPARVARGLAEAAVSAAATIAERLDYVGVLCVEFFVLRSGALLVNELAPRPHNSGHYTIDACVTSQFEQQVRALAGLPLGSTAQHCPAVMVNLLGELWRAGEPDWTRVLRHEAAKLHLYGKREARPGRKMGHYTVLAPHLESAIETARAIRRDLER